MTSADQPQTEAQSASRAKIVIASLAALVLAAVVLVFLILPAEYGVDVTGAGERAGLTDLAETGEMTELERGALRQGVLTLTGAPILNDRWERELAPYEGVELKYTMEEGEAMVFSWRADAPVEYDLHSHPFEGGVELTEGYGVGSAEAQQGVYIAAFSGIHGWYWQNRTLDNVTVTLEATGGFTHSTVFEGGPPTERPIEGGDGGASGLPSDHQMQPGAAD